MTFIHIEKFEFYHGNISIENVWLSLYQLTHERKNIQFLRSCIKL